MSVLLLFGLSLGWYHEVNFLSSSYLLCINGRAPVYQLSEGPNINNTDIKPRYWLVLIHILVS